MRGETNERKFAILTQRLSRAKCANYAVSGFVELLHSAFSWQETYTILTRRFEGRSFPSLLMYDAFSFLSDRRVNSSPLFSNLVFKMIDRSMDVTFRSN